MLVLLFLTSILAGAINSIAGGGTLLTFPVLLTLLSPVMANATSTVALLPGTLAGAWGFRRELSAVKGMVWSLSIASVLGGMIGALLLTCLPPDVFKWLIPWLLLFCAVLFSARTLLTRLRPADAETEARLSRRAPLGLWLVMLLVAVYGGYFGAAMGILTLAAFSAAGMGDIHKMNAAKAFLTSCTNAIAAAIFVVQGNVAWKYALLMGSGAIIGGYLGARMSRRLDRRLVQGLIVVIAYGLATYFFLRGRTS